MADSRPQSKPRRTPPHGTGQLRSSSLRPTERPLNQLKRNNKPAVHKADLSQVVDCTLSPESAATQSELDAIWLLLGDDLDNLLDHQRAHDFCKAF
jgi:hypothetical protein